MIFDFYFLKWLSELNQFYKDVPILLIGTKLDLKKRLKTERIGLNSSKNKAKNKNDATETNCVNSPNLTQTVLDENAQENSSKSFILFNLFAEALNVYSFLFL